MDSKKQPEITFVRYARNDGYAPNYDQRLNFSIQVLAQQAEKYKVPIEILIVEWNPPPTEGPLRSILHGVQGMDYTTLRIVTVPPEYHDGFGGAASKGLHPARALNVGYRRARGRFATPFASDSLLTDAVFEYAATIGFDENNVYRLDRYDLKPEFLEPGIKAVHDHAALFDLCEENVINKHSNQDEILCDPLGLPRLHTNAAGDFLLMSRSRWHKLGGQPEDCDVSCLDTDSITLHAAMTLGGEEIRLPGDCRVYKISHGLVNHLRVQPIWNHWSRTLSAAVRFLTKSTQSRAYLRGLLDIPRRKMAGMPGTYRSFERNFYLKARRWHKDGIPVRLNPENWGLGNIDLKETEF